MLLWHTLSSGAQLAAVEGDDAVAADYAARAAALKTAIDALLWDDATRLVQDLSRVDGASAGRQLARASGTGS